MYVLLIHGADTSNRDLLKRLLEDLHVPCRVLQEEITGEVLMYKAIDAIRDSAFVIALYTGDERVVRRFHKKAKQNHPQPGLNLMWELGVAFGAKEPREICVVMQRGTYVPEMLEGYDRIEFDRSVEDCADDLERLLARRGLIAPPVPV